MPGKKLLFMGGEIGQWHEWEHDSEIDWALLDHTFHHKLRRFIGDLNELYRSHGALHELDFNGKTFSWIQCDDWQNSVYAFLRRAKDPNDFVACVFNFTPVPRDNYRIGIPQPGYYAEILNSDAEIYGGSNVGNLGGVYSEAIPMHGCEQSISLRLPPLAAVVLKPTLPAK
jgi:1,4-alpha-glucan branching enzyme